MSNETGDQLPHFSKGMVLRADDLNKIVNMVMRRIVGGGDVLVQALAGDVAVILKKKDQRTAAPNTVLATLTDYDTDTNEYEWELFEGAGPDTGRCIELNGAQGVPIGTRVVLRRAAAVWYFVAPALSLQRYKVAAIGDNTLTVQLLENATLAGAGAGFAAGSSQITIWKPLDLQRQVYDGLTIDGVTYTHVNAQTRTGDDGSTEETQLIIPPYVVGSVICAVVVGNGAAAAGEPRRLMDANVSGRAWAKGAE